MRAVVGAVRSVIQAIEPFDDVEGNHRADALRWVDSGAPLFRQVKPDQPGKHLVSYFPVLDAKKGALLLVDHRKSGLWLPPGGHVDPGETPISTVEREVREELGRGARYTAWQGRDPFFITVTELRGEGAHTDVSLWYVLDGDVHEALNYDQGELGGYVWLTFGDLEEMDGSLLDPHMHRFVSKLQLNLQ